MSFIKIFNKDKQSKNSLYESVLAKYQKKHSDIFVDTCHLMNETENHSEFLKSINSDFKPMNCYLEQTFASKFGHTYNYRIIHGCDYSNSFVCNVSVDDNFEVSFIIDLYFPATIRISAVKTDDTYFDNKKVILDIIDKSLNLINEILTDELDRIKNIIMQLNLVYKDYPADAIVTQDKLIDIKEAYLFNIKHLMEYRLFYLVPHEVTPKYNSFYIIGDPGQPKEFIEELANGKVRRFTPSDVEFVSAESFDNYALAIKLLVDKHNMAFNKYFGFEKIDIPDT